MPVIPYHGTSIHTIAVNTTYWEEVQFNPPTIPALLTSLQTIRSSFSQRTLLALGLLISKSWCLCPSFVCPQLFFTGGKIEFWNLHFLQNQHPLHLKQLLIKPSNFQKDYLKILWYGAHVHSSLCYMTLSAISCMTVFRFITVLSCSILLMRLRSIHISIARTFSSGFSLVYY